MHGDIVDPHSIPYQVALLNSTILTTKGVYASFTCGASLISPNFVLTGKMFKKDKFQGAEFTNSISKIYYSKVQGHTLKEY